MVELKLLKDIWEAKDWLGFSKPFICPTLCHIKEKKYPQDACKTLSAKLPLKICPENVLMKIFHGQDSTKESKIFAVDKSSTDMMHTVSISKSILKSQNTFAVWEAQPLVAFDIGSLGNSSTEMYNQDIPARQLVS